MSHKLPFQVVHVSGCDDNHSGKELEVQGPTSKGWQSSRFCVYPQEIVLSLKEPSKIVKLQILSHQYNIASKIEMFVAYPLSYGSKSMSGIKFRRLGYVPLSPNEATDFKARELKSVYLDADGQFIKLLVHKNYVNKRNLYNQVCIIAINMLGQSLVNDSDDNANYLLTGDTNTEIHLNHAPIPQARYDGGKFISPLDDLSFDMYMDPETAQLIRRLEEKKREAVLEERFDFANKLKQAMSDLYHVGEKLGKFEVDKRRAIEMEEYEVAKSKKVQSDEYRLYVYKQLNVFDLLEIEKKKEEKVLPHQKIETNHVATSPNLLTPLTTPPRHSPDIKLPPVSTSNNKLLDVEKETVLTPRISVAIHDERPLPTLKNKSIVAEEPTEKKEEPEHEVEPDLSILTEKEELEATIIIDIFGMFMTRKLYSKSWKFRQEALSYFSKELSNPEETSEHSPSRISRSVVAVLKKALKDQVFVVLQQSDELLKHLLLEYIPKNRLNKSELSHAVEKLLPIMLKRAGDNVPRSRNMMFDSAVEIANIKAVKTLNVAPSIVCEPIKSKKQPPWRLLKSQIDLIAALIPDLGMDKNGFNIENVMKILNIGLLHPNSQVRDASLSCIMEIYKIIKEPVKKYFPPDDANSRKNPLYVKLFDGFDKADGKLTAAERKAAEIIQKEQMEKNKEEELKALQTQLEQLRSMAQNQINLNSSNANENFEENEATTKQYIKPANAGGKNILKESSRRQSKLAPKKDSIKPEIDKLCIFCGEQSEEFTDEKLDVHYWKSCPMLKRCHSCTEVVEISAMNEHLITECEHKELHMKCKVCEMVITRAEEKSHIKSNECQEGGKKKWVNRCPLCHVPVADGDENWKSHLVDNCKVNSERLQKSKEKKTIPKGGRKTPGQAGGRGAARGRGRGTKIPYKTPVRKK